MPHEKASRLANARGSIDEHVRQELPHTVWAPFCEQRQHFFADTGTSIPQQQVFEDRR